MSKECLYMWSYWKDRKGIKDALKDYYPDTLQNDLNLQQALAQLSNAERAISARMEELIKEQPDDE